MGEGEKESAEDQWGKDTMTLAVKQAYTPILVCTVDLLDLDGPLDGYTLHAGQPPHCCCK